MFFKKENLKTGETETINELDLETNSEKQLFKKLNILLIVVCVIASMIALDIICVKKFHKGPFFAIPVHVYSDGGTKVSYGLFYKVIQYHQLEGRRDTAVGLWTMKYQKNPKKVTTVDLAIAFGDDKKAAYQEYFGKYVEIDGEVASLQNKEVMLKFVDESKKYNLNISCHLLSKKPSKMKKKDRIKVVGTIDDYQIKNKISTLTLKKCFVK